MTAKEMHTADPDRRIGRIIAIVRTEVHAGFGIAQCRLLACPFLLVLWTDIRDESCAAAHGNTGTGLTLSSRDLRHAEFGVGGQHLLPLTGQADRMLRRAICECGFSGRGAQCVDSGNREQERMGDIWLGAPA